MESTATKQALEQKADAAVVVTAVPVVQPAQSRSERAKKHQAVGYGMPCAKCRAYYPSDMQACPICKSEERVSPTASRPLPAAAVSPESDEAKRLAEERERLRELKSQIYASHSPMPAPTPFRCALDQNHSGNAEPAAVCHSCYGEIRQRADRVETALHMDPKDGEKIVYDAVWADTSDPNKTYLNAATALLSELRRRAGIDVVPGSSQQQSD